MAQTQRRIDEALNDSKNRRKRAHHWSSQLICPPPVEWERLTGGVPQVDILINNLGIFEPKPFNETADDEWLRFFEVNVMGSVGLSRAVFQEC